jgi:hypothetical protein
LAPGVARNGRRSQRRRRKTKRSQRAPKRKEIRERGTYLIFFN